jgi:hypothetical protein
VTGLLRHHRHLAFQRKLRFKKKRLRPHLAILSPRMPVLRSRHRWRRRRKI